MKRYVAIDTSPINGWFTVETVPDHSKAFACFVPQEETGEIETTWAKLAINDPAAEHGPGDFVIAKVGKDGKPDLSDSYVVNGKVFARTYDTSDFKDFVISGAESFDDLTKAPNLVDEIIPQKENEK